MIMTFCVFSLTFSTFCYCNHIMRLWTYQQDSSSGECVWPMLYNTLRPRQNGRHFADDIFNCIFLNENVSIAIKFSLKFVPNCPIDNIPALVQIIAWRRPGDKPLSEPMMVNLPTHINVARPQWDNRMRTSTCLVFYVFINLYHFLLLYSYLQDVNLSEERNSEWIWAAL